jgi:site-specific DNA-methyltransferase (adenine-specific)
VTRSRSIIVGDALTELRTVPNASVDMVLTSPPYFQLRDYAVTGQLGLESTVDDWVDNLSQVAAELGRVLTPTGTFWLNVGDSFAIHARQGAPRKSLLLGPERLALRLVADGWLLRNKIVWRKANPMPTSVRDRLACTWEAIYVFARQREYFLDLDAIRAPHTSRPSRRNRTTALVRGRAEWRGPNSGGTRGLAAIKAAGRVGHPLGKNPGDVWTIASSNFRGAHRATFPQALAARAIRAGCPEVRCRACRQPWRRPVLRAVGGTAVRSVLAPTCNCSAASEPGTVLDPFFGAGTTGMAAEGLSRQWLGIELSPTYAQLAEERITAARASPQAA